MSLTSYRAAPPRAKGVGSRWDVGSWGGCRSGLAVTYSPASWDAVPSAPGALNGRVRDGIGCFAQAMATRPDRDPPREHRAAGLLGGRRRAVPSRAQDQSGVHDFRPGTGAGLGGLAVTGSDQAYRTISTGQLSALPRVHLRPIDVVVCHGPQGIPGFEGGFPLRCLQRLSCPFIATQHCRWHDNWSTSGTFTPVLSY